MSRATLELRLVVDFVICPKCNKGPKDNSQQKVEKFLQDHATHINSTLNQHPRIVGYLSSPTLLKAKKIAIRFVEEPKIVAETIDCRYKKCKNYKRGCKSFCKRRCKKKYKQYKSRRK